jgi:DNA-binding MarR family transcriptional regulator
MIDYESIKIIAYFNLLKTGSWIEENIKARLKPNNLTHSQLNILHILIENHPKPISANELREKLIVPSPDLTRLLDRLVKKGWVERELCQDNRRKIDISVTKSGELAFKNAQAALKEFMDSMLDRITDSEAKQLRKILHKLRQ